MNPPEEPFFNKPLIFKSTSSPVVFKKGLNNNLRYMV